MFPAAILFQKALAHGDIDAASWIYRRWPSDCDVSVEEDCNLLVAPLTGRGYKPPPDRTQGDQEDYATTVGRFLPRGVTLVTDRDGKEFHVRTAPIGTGTVKPRRIPVTPEHSVKIFARKVEPLLEGGWETMFSSVRWANAAAGIPDGALRDWRVGHEHFSELRGLYEAARELVD